VTEHKATPEEDVKRILESAQRLGVELDEEEALQWLTAVSAAKSGADVSFDARTGVFGHAVSMLDFSPEELSYFRKVGALVEIPDREGLVETALALSGSAAQSKIQTYPGDADYFERVNIKAASREEACRILGEVIRDKALEKFAGPSYQLIEVKFGSYPHDVIRDGKSLSAGSPISWTPAELQAGQIFVTGPDGEGVNLTWVEVGVQPGWCKLDWVVLDPVRKTLANASNMLDATWESPDGGITPLDGYLDPYFQEVYLEAEAIPLFSKLVKHVSADALEEYVAALRKEVGKYLTRQINYGKAAKRMYNIFRLTGRYGEAAYVRELFDEPATALYQVWSLIRTIDDIVQRPGTIPREALGEQADKLIISVIKALEGVEEEELVRTLLNLKDALSLDVERGVWDAQVETARAEVIRLVNNFFHDRLVAVPAINAYIEEVRESLA